MSSVTHTCSRPVDTVVSNITIPSFLTGLNAVQHRPPISSLQPSNRFPGWPCPPWTPQFQAHSGVPCDPSYSWSTFPGNHSSNPRLPSDTSSSKTSLAREVRETLGELKKSLISDLKVVSDRLHALKSRSGAPVEPFSSNQCRQEEDDSLYMAPGSQEASFLTVEEEAVPTSTVSKKSVSSALNRAGTPEKKVVLLNTNLRSFRFLGIS